MDILTVHSKHILQKKTFELKKKHYFIQSYYFQHTACTPSTRQVLSFYPNGFFYIPTGQNLDKINVTGALMTTHRHYFMSTTNNTLLIKAGKEETANLVLKIKRSNT